MGQFHSFFTIGLIQQSSIPFPFNYLERWENSCKIALCFNVSPRVYFHLNHEAGIFPIRSSDCPGSVHERFRAGCEARRRAVKNSKPNVIFILVDDMGWGDLDSNWSQQKLNGRTVDRKNEFRTPALSALAREGIQLRRHYSAAPVCAPARASLLLGGAPGEFPRGEEQPL